MATRITQKQKQAISDMLHATEWTQQEDSIMGSSEAFEAAYKYIGEAADRFEKAFGFPLMDLPKPTDAKKG